MKLIIERATNGFVVRGDDRDDIAVVVGDRDPSLAAQNLLWEVNERIGHVGTRYDARRVGVIVRPGDKWELKPGDTYEHPWVEHWVLSGRDKWWCGCGLEFSPLERAAEGARALKASSEEAS